MDNGNAEDTKNRQDVIDIHTDNKNIYTHKLQWIKSTWDIIPSYNFHTFCFFLVFLVPLETNKTVTVYFSFFVCFQEDLTFYSGRKSK